MTKLGIIINSLLNIHISEISIVSKVYSCMMCGRVIPVNAIITPNPKCTAAKFSPPHACK